MPHPLTKAPRKPAKNFLRGQTKATIQEPIIKLMDKEHQHYNACLSEGTAAAAMRLMESTLEA